ncbi:hypothetical protein GCM10009863_30030 [Streptomyces axinellae]|uniref:Urocanase Rossmann-like domain-containing protein n=1 Tax=Streptomyces axinellae TaxID=552788 RepID=A0ABN3Q3Z1_9ACTN
MSSTCPASAHDPLSYLPVGVDFPDMAAYAAEKPAESTERARESIARREEAAVGSPSPPAIWSGPEARVPSRTAKAARRPSRGGALGPRMRRPITAPREARPQRAWTD